MPGDVYFDERILEPLFKTEYSSCLVRKLIRVTDEIKYRANEEGFITELSKNIENQDGEFLGISVIKKSKKESCFEIFINGFGISFINLIPLPAAKTTASIFKPSPV